MDVQKLCLLVCLVCMPSAASSFYFYPSPCEVHLFSCHETNACPFGTQQRSDLLCYNGKRCCAGIPACVPGSCVHGSCIIDSNGREQCTCAPGYSGTRCDVDACGAGNPCVAGQGSCVRDTSPAGFRCQCNEGFVGTYCEVDALCGRQTTSRLLNGVAEAGNANPWLVTVRSAQGDVVLCSGVLIDDNWIATDAYCMTLCTGTKGGCRVEVGSFNRLQNEWQERTRTIEEIRFHPGVPFKTGDELQQVLKNDPDRTLDYNIALARLSWSVPTTFAIKRACQPTSIYGTCFEEQNCIVAGFSTISPVVQSGTRAHLTVKVLPDPVCEYMRNRTQPTSTHCGLSLQADSGICFGDNGGALLCQHPETGAWSAEGIVAHFPDASSPFRCSLRHFVFTDMSFVWGWVKSVIDPPDGK
ncbi:kallikrein 1-related peptidase b16-like [Haliotis rufescens]|uniref:kallikrein 1-related peptidase b16-like n=1 Tax=Haliotis rufescens TaxID=6454 RepID=UPI00201EA86F|nr:kallikrein 1-related peptidase b16-like [Haliotis rufescens]XP_048249292.1 kallikrein 1-related peptidase b16-like [Haliotis rufescens]